MNKRQKKAREQALERTPLHLSMIEIIVGAPSHTEVYNSADPTHAPTHLRTLTKATPRPQDKGNALATRAPKRKATKQPLQSWVKRISSNLLHLSCKRAIPKTQGNKAVTAVADQTNSQPLATSLLQKSTMFVKPWCFCDRDLIL